MLPEKTNFSTNIFFLKCYILNYNMVMQRQYIGVTNTHHAGMKVILRVFFSLKINKIKKSFKRFHLNCIFMFPRALTNMMTSTEA